MITLISSIIVFIFNINLYAKSNEVKYHAMYQDIKGIGNNEPYPGGNLDDNDEELSMEECRSIIKKEVSKISDKFNKIIKNNAKDSFYYRTHNLKGESTIDRNLFFCWPTDATQKEEDFFYKYGYISPKTKDRIFPLGERKYTNEPKVKMELAEEDKK